MSTLGQNLVKALTLSVPKYGSWRAGIVLEHGRGSDLLGAQTLTIGKLAMSGTVRRADDDAPALPHAVLVGGLGWHGELTQPLSYRSATGVRVTTILRDLANLAGEQIEMPAEMLVGDHYSFQASTDQHQVLLRDVLADLAHAGFVPPWRIDADGVTRFGARTGSEITVRATVLRKNSGVGVTVLGIDDPLSFMPGNLLNGTPIARLVVNEESRHLTAEVWS